MPHSSSSQEPPPTALVFWIIWFSLFSGMFVIMMFAGGGWPGGENTEPYLSAPMFWIPVGMFFASMIVRWLIIPRINNPTALMPPAVIGMALAEGCLILALFALPEGMIEGKRLLCVLAFIGVGLYAPIYLNNDSGPRDFSKPQ